MHTQISIKQSFQNKRQEHWLDTPELVLIHNNVSILTTWRLWTSEHLSYLLRIKFWFWFRVIYPYMQKMITIN
jgi:hypothetical protein